MNPVSFFEQSIQVEMEKRGYLGMGFDDGETPRPVRLFSVGPEEVVAVLLRRRRGIGRRSSLLGGR